MGDKCIKSEIWDTAGQERYGAITSAYYRSAVGALLVYDITRKKSFENVKNWMKVLQQFAMKDVVVQLVGNKLDLEHLRTVSTKEGMLFAKDNCISFMETSALDCTNVDAVLNSITSVIYRSYTKRVADAVLNDVSIISDAQPNNITKPYNDKSGDSDWKLNCCW